VTPFAGDCVRPGQYFPVHDDASADARSGDHTEHDIPARTRAVDGFGQRETICVIGDTNGPTQCSCKIAVERAADEPGRVGVLHQPGAWAYRPRNPDSDGAFLASLRLGRRDEPGDGADCCVVIAGRSRDSLPQTERAVPLECCDFDLAAAKVDSEAHG
jgi:hypothetical protein